ncbi:MAG: hypothetical protein CALGDGBN_01695 [Pseudomonadales bacterium]|nr:hypothetical protein [Pseudomonadales bacterium]
MPILRRDVRVLERLRCTAPLALALALGVGGGAAFAQDDAATRYARLLADAESIAAHNALIERQLGSQQSELQALQTQLAGMDQTAAEFPALLQRMFEKLEQFVAADLPFVDPVSDRKARVERIRELMGSEGGSPSERFRRLLEAYQIEIEYGRTMADYKATLPDGREAEFVRIGRVSLMYRTADGEEAGYWDAQRGEWVADDDYKAAIAKALRIARKELAPDVVEVPVQAAKEVSS